jgi:hypothetical protein
VSKRGGGGGDRRYLGLGGCVMERYSVDATLVLEGNTALKMERIILRKLGKQVSNPLDCQLSPRELDGVSQSPRSSENMLQESGSIDIIHKNSNRSLLSTTCFIFFPR